MFPVYNQSIFVDSFDANAYMNPRATVHFITGTGVNIIHFIPFIVNGFSCTDPFTITGMKCIKIFFNYFITCFFNFEGHALEN
jgi:hypothetical protein